MEGVAAKKAKLDRYNELAELLGRDADEMARAAGRDRRRNLWDLDRQIDQAMDALRCPPDDARRQPLGRRDAAASRCAGCCSPQPELLLLDEPTNHLDAETVAWLEQHLHDYPGAILLVTHDRYFLDNVTNWILELDRGRGIPYEGNYSAWLEQKQKRLGAGGREEEARRQVARARAGVDPASPQGAQAKSKARIDAYEDLLAKANEARPPRPRRSSSRAGPRLGGTVIEARPDQGATATGS